MPGKSENATSYKSRKDATDPNYRAVAIALGAAIGTVRIERGVTQAELGKAAGVHRVSIAHFETGHRMPSLMTLVMAARSLRIPISELVSCLDDLALEGA